MINRRLKAIEERRAALLTRSEMHRDLLRAALDHLRLRPGDTVFGRALKSRHVAGAIAGIVMMRWVGKKLGGWFERRWLFKQPGWRH